MNSVFMKAVNLSISASWLILAVLAARFLLKKAPKRLLCLLWVLVAVRLIFPFTVESGLSVLPKTEWVAPPTESEILPPSVIDAVGMGEKYPDTEVSVDIRNPTVIVRKSLSVRAFLPYIWLCGIAVLFVCAAVSYRRLKSTVSASVPVGDGVLACDAVQSPFILGIVRPKIYIPSAMAGETLDFVITHENAHIARRDHLWKPLGYLLLTVYWFNPLLWLAYALLCRDIEAACDEKVVEKMSGVEKAAYSQALLDCSFPRRSIAACPLAFGEVGVKERVKSVLNYKKPAFWVTFIAVAAVAVLAVCFLTNRPKDGNSIGIGSNVAEIDAQSIHDEIRKTVHADTPNTIIVNMNDMGLTLDADFHFTEDSRMGFVFQKGEEYYSAELTAKKNKGLAVAEIVKCDEPEKVYLFASFLEALTYLPQNEVARLLPDARGYRIGFSAEGTPESCENAITYGPDGVREIEGWMIHLTVEPLYHKNETGKTELVPDSTEMLHLFYDMNYEKGNATVWFDGLKNGELNQNTVRKVWDEKFPGVTFESDCETIKAVTAEKTVTLISGKPIWNAYFCHLNGDGKQEICATVENAETGRKSIILCDYANGISCEMTDSDADYTLVNDHGILCAEKNVGGKTVESGRLVLTVTEGGTPVLQIKKPLSSVPFAANIVYSVVEVTYENPALNYTMVAQENTPEFMLDKDYHLLIRLGNGGATDWTDMGEISETELKKENFDNLFSKNGGAGWFMKEFASDIRKNTVKAWTAIKENSFHTILQQKNGELFIAEGVYDAAEKGDAYSDDTNILRLFRIAQNAIIGEYVCEKEGFGGEFTLTLNKDGTFRYYEGMLSSYIGMGKWELRGRELVLIDGGMGEGRRFCFTVEGTSLIFNKEKSAKFTYLDIADGTRFVRKPASAVVKWFDMLGAEAIWDGTLETTLTEYPGVTFRWSLEKLEAVTERETVLIYSGMPIWSVYFADLNGDGRREVCSNVSFGSGIVDTRIIVCDYVNGNTYALQGRNTGFDYILTEKNGRLWAEKRVSGIYGDGEPFESGKLLLSENGLSIGENERNEYLGIRFTAEYAASDDIALTMKNDTTYRVEISDYNYLYRVDGKELTEIFSRDPKLFPEEQRNTYPGETAEGMLQGVKSDYHLEKGHYILAVSVKLTKAESNVSPSVTVQTEFDVK